MARRTVSPRDLGAARVHLWLGLTLGALMVLAGVTGALRSSTWRSIARCIPRCRWRAALARPTGDRAAATLHAAFPARTGPWRLG
jgi:hypothetical protein